MGISLNAIKTAANVLKEAGKIEQYNQILDLQQELLDLQEANLKLKAENTELKKRLAIKKKVIFEDFAYFTNDEDGPFCSRCFDKENNLIRLKGRNGSYTCPECKNMFRSKDYSIRL